MSKEQTPQEVRSVTPTNSDPRPLDVTQLEQVVGGFSASVGANKWGRGRGKSLGIGAGADWKY